MTKSSLISVVIAVYNIEDYVLKCIESVAGQDYENLDIIVVDDGSTDGSGMICDEFARSDERVRVYHKKNGGLSDARNYGIEKARGEIVALVDGDDCVEPSYIGAMYNRMLETNADIVVCGFNDEVPGVIVVSGREATIKLLTQQKNMEIVAWNKLYRRQIFIENKIRYPLNEKHEDALTTYKLLSAAKRVSYVNKSLYNYVVRTGSIMDEARMEERLKMRERAAMEAVGYFCGDKDLTQAANIAVLTAKYAYVDNAINGNIPHKYLLRGIKWIREHANEYKNNQYMTKKLRLYNKLCGNDVGEVFYKIFRKVRHD